MYSNTPLSISCHIKGPTVHIYIDWTSETLRVWATASITGFTMILTEADFVHGTLPRGRNQALCIILHVYIGHDKVVTVRCIFHCFKIHSSYCEINVHQISSNPLTRNPISRNLFQKQDSPGFSSFWAVLVQDKDLHNQGLWCGAEVTWKIVIMMCLQGLYIIGWGLVPDDFSINCFEFVWIVWPSKINYFDFVIDCKIIISDGQSAGGYIIL